MKRSKLLGSLLMISLVIFSCTNNEKLMTAPELAVGENEVLFSNTRLVNDEFENTPIVALANSRSKYMIAFNRQLEDGTILSFEAERFRLPIVMMDNEGTSWDITGSAVDGPRRGTKLKPLVGTIGYWLAWSSMFPKVAIKNTPAESVDLQNVQYDSEWEIPVSHIHRGCAVDGIVSIDNPKFTRFDSRDYIDKDFFLNDDDLLVLTKYLGKWRAYPIKILDWHEVVNDKVNGQSFVVSYCPLSGSSNAFVAKIDGTNVEFGVSGLLYNSNLILYDRLTNSLWQQMQFKSVNGERKGDKLDILPSLEISWATLRGMDIPVEIMTEETGYNINYDEFPYGNYQNNVDIITSRTFEDDRFPLKERVLGITLNEKTKVYRFEDFLEN